MRLKSALLELVKLLRAIQATPIVTRSTVMDVRFRLPRTSTIVALAETVVPTLTAQRSVAREAVTLLVSDCGMTVTVTRTMVAKLQSTP